MGQKVNPRSLRLQVDKDWSSRWFTKRDYAVFLIEDIKLRDIISKKLGTRAGVRRVDLERSPNLLTITIFSSKPGVVIGRGGSGAEELKNLVAKLATKPVKINIEEVKHPETDARLIAENVASQLERRISFRRALKGAAESAMRGGAKGVKVMVAGRLGGAEMSRREQTVQGSIPLHTIRADIDYGAVEAHTTYGIIGVKAWVYHGQKFNDTGK